MLFAWTVVKYVKSNAIIFCKDNMTDRCGRRADEPRLQHQDRRNQGRRRRLVG